MMKIGMMGIIFEFLGMEPFLVKDNHPDCDTPPSLDYGKYKPIDIHGARNTTVEGITLTDSAMHSLMLINSYLPGQPNEVSWVKILHGVVMVMGLILLKYAH